METARRLLSRLIRPLRRLVARRSRGREGLVAKQGGRPVRDTWLRPWATEAEGNALRWHTDAGGRLRRIFVSGVEGLPQERAEEFAARWADFCACRHALLMAHGTDALRIGLAAVLEHDGLDYGGEVIVPNFTFVASATAALDRRFGVAFVDVDPDTLLIDPDQVEAAVVPGRTRAILPVHLFGQPADMTAIRAVANRHGLKIIEDAAQAHGAAWEGSPAGSFGDAAGFSFQSSKTLSCGEGGALTTSDPGVFERAYSMHNVGRSRLDGHRWEHLDLGWNCRITEYQAALLAHRMRFFNRLQARRRGAFGTLARLLDDVECVETVAVHPSVSRHGTYMFPMRYRPERCGGLPVDAFVDHVRAEGIPLHRAFPTTVSDLPAIRKLMDRRPEYFRLLPTPEADRAARDTVFLPHHVLLAADRDLEDVAVALGKVERHFT